MNRELEFWRFIAGRLQQNEAVVLLVVARSTGSSPGRQGYKMAVGSDGEMTGSIGGGVMEVALVEKCREILRTHASDAASAQSGVTSLLIKQVHKKDTAHASGMICSGRQEVILQLLTANELPKIEWGLELLTGGTPPLMIIAHDFFAIGPKECGFGGPRKSHFEKTSAANFTYSEYLGPLDELCIIGGGHCSLALSELMSKMDFHIRIFDDRPELNTLEKNNFAQEIEVIDGYQKIADFITSGKHQYVVVMTLGYASDEMVIRSLIDMDFKYFGVLGSKAKMATLMKTLKNEGFPAERLARIRTPIGLPINSHTPEEIAVSIAAEIISVKNSKKNNAIFGQEHFPLSGV